MRMGRCSYAATRDAPARSNPKEVVERGAAGREWEPMEPPTQAPLSHTGYYDYIPSSHKGKDIHRSYGRSLNIALIGIARPATKQLDRVIWHPSPCSHGSSTYSVLLLR